jgi:hypothetical protein
MPACSLRSSKFPMCAGVNNLTSVPAIDAAVILAAEPGASLQTLVFELTVPSGQRLCINDLLVLEACPTDDAACPRTPLDDQPAPSSHHDAPPTNPPTKAAPCMRKRPPSKCMGVLCYLARPPMYHVATRPAICHRGQRYPAEVEAALKSPGSYSWTVTPYAADTTTFCRETAALPAVRAPEDGQPGPAPGVGEALLSPADHLTPYQLHEPCRVWPMELLVRVAHVLLCTSPSASCINTSQYACLSHMQTL